MKCFSFLDCNGNIRFNEPSTYAILDPLPIGYDCRVTITFSFRKPMECRLARYIQNSACPNSRLMIRYWNGTESQYCSNVTSPLQYRFNQHERYYVWPHPIQLHLTAKHGSITNHPLRYECRSRSKNLFQ